MLSNVKFNNLEVVGGGSTYNINDGKQTRGLAFYYLVNGVKQPRKIFTSSSDEKNFKKAIKFLEKLDKEYEENKTTSTRTIVADNSINVPAPVRITFKEIGAEWFKEYSSRLNQPAGGLSCSSVENRELCFRTICRHIGDMFIDEINQDTVRNIINLCGFKDDGTKYSFSHMDKLQQTFHLIMKYADKHNLYKYQLERENLDVFLKADTDSKFMDREQIAEIMELLKDNERYSLVVECMYTSGLRQEELFSLTLNDFHVENKDKVSINIHGSIRRMYKNKYSKVDLVKNKNSLRKAYISYELYEKITNYYNNIVDNETTEDKKNRKLYNTEGLIFVNRDKNVINKRTFERNFKNYLKRRINKLEKELGYNTTLHMFRHSFVSLNAENLSMETIAKVLGDSSKTVEENYYSLSDKVTDEVSASTKKVANSINKIRNSKK